MFADVIEFERLIELGHEAHGFVEQLHSRTKQIAKDSGHCHHDVDAWTAEFGERNRFDTRCPVERVAHWPRAEEPERLSHTFALRLDVIESPQHERHCFRVTTVLVPITFEQTVCDGLAACIRGGGRNTVWIDRVRVSTGGKNVGVLNDVRTWTRLDVLPAQRAHE